MDCRHAISLMHEYLDGDLDHGNSVMLKEHLQTCPSCKQHLNELEQAEVFAATIPPLKVPANLAVNIIESFPPEKKSSVVFRWLKRYPALSVASIFIIAMVSSYTIQGMGNEPELVVRGTDIDKIMIENNKVIVPSGVEIAGDLVIENGELWIQEDAGIKGDVVIIDGELVASTANIEGKIREVNETIDLLWYKLIGFFRP
ncbi:anti-sigma factor family protein [Longirhabdus pacifica]|uniref:anti-sigma factor family protein n=1 Tax=Longirhabdus pacifica TaxID=2305227 RepID=UPI0013E8AA2A|nr:zf-HC2 domain-containing protein [Longirhabdus pacifica]